MIHICNGLEKFNSAKAIDKVIIDTKNILRKFIHKDLEQIKFKYEFGKHSDEIHCFLFELDFCEITELIGEEFVRNFSFKSKNGYFVLNCKLNGNTEIYKIKRISETDYFVECGFDKIFSELERLEK